MATRRIWSHFDVVPEERIRALNQFQGSPCKFRGVCVRASLLRVEDVAEGWHLDYYTYYTSTHFKYLNTVRWDTYISIALQFLLCFQKHSIHKVYHSISNALALHLRVLSLERELALSSGESYQPRSRSRNLFKKRQARCLSGVGVLPVYRGTRAINPRGKSRLCARLRGINNWDDYMRTTRQPLLRFFFCSSRDIISRALL